MQARGSNAQNQQNQNPNVGATAASTSSAVNSNEVKANLDSMLEISVDKRNVKSGSRGGKRKRINTAGANPESSQDLTTSVVQ